MKRKEKRSMLASIGKKFQEKFFSLDQFSESFTMGLDKEG